MAAIRARLLLVGFYPQEAESVRGRPPPAVVSLADRNRATKEKGFPAVEWQQLAIIRGVELWLDVKATLCDYTWSVVMCGPTAAKVQYPVRSGELMPWAYNITFYQQVKGHWFWAMYRDESCGKLVVKWVRGNAHLAATGGNTKSSHK